MVIHVNISLYLFNIVDSFIEEDSFIAKKKKNRIKGDRESENLKD